MADVWGWRSDVILANNLCHAFCHHRIEPTHAISSDREIRRMKLMRLYKFQNAAIHPRALWLHDIDVKNKLRTYR
jgi:hypothetical protein